MTPLRLDLAFPETPVQPPAEIPIINWQQIKNNLNDYNNNFKPFSVPELWQLCEHLEKGDHFSQAWQQGFWDPVSQIMHIRRKVLHGCELPYPINVIEGRIVVLYKGNHRKRIGEGIMKRVAFSIDLLSLESFAQPTIILDSTRELTKDQLLNQLEKEMNTQRSFAGNEQVVQFKNSYIYPAKTRGAGNYKLGLILENCNEGELYLAICNSPDDYEPSRLLKHSLSNTLAVFDDFFTGLASLEERQIVYRDIKPENLLLAWDGSRLRLKFTDFGMANKIDDEKDRMQVKTTCPGTKGYVCPFLFDTTMRNMQIVDSQLLEMICGHQSDIWSAGVVLHLLLTDLEVRISKNPLKAIRCNQKELSQCVKETAHLSRAFPSLWLVPETHQVLCEMLVGMLQLHPNNRLTGGQLLKKWQEHRANLSNDQIETVDKKLDEDDYTELNQPPLPNKVYPKDDDWCTIL